VLSSRYEGFPNVAARSDGLRLSLPERARLSPTGPAEILENGRNGLLLPADAEATQARPACPLPADWVTTASLVPWGEEARR